MPPSPPKSSPRLRLNHERISAAAIELVDEDGIDALSMRTLAGRLGVSVMSLYNHVQNKEALLEAIVERVSAELVCPDEDATWDEALRQRARSLRNTTLAHPWSARLVESTPQLGPARLRALDTLLGCLVRGGFSIEDAGRAILLIDSYVFGYVLQETSWRTPADASQADTAEALAPHVSFDAYPHFGALLMHHQTAPTSRTADPQTSEFLHGLDRIVAALAPR
jgi:AcrR family transcriptional regulator